MGSNPTVPKADFKLNPEEQQRLERLEAARGIVNQYQSTGAQVKSPGSKESADSQASQGADTGDASQESADRALYLEAREAAVRYIGLDKGKSSGKVRDSLVQKGYAPSLAHRVVQDLIDLDYINDVKACAKIARRHQGKKAKSRSYMLSLFIQQGVDRKVAEAYLDQLPRDEVSLQEVLAGNRQELDGGTKEARLMRRLQTRGYNYGLIKTNIRRLKEADAR